MEKILNYTLDIGGIFPTEPLCGGYQGEHRATAICFSPTEELLDELSSRQAVGSVFSVKTEFITEAGEIFSAEQDLSRLSEPFFITSDMSQSGLDSVVMLIITETDIKGDRAEFLRASAELYFLAGRGYGQEVDRKCEADLIAQKTAEALLAIEGKCAEAEGATAEGVAKMQELQLTVAQQLKKTVTAAEAAQGYARDAQNSAELCEKAALSASAQTEKAKEYCVAAGNIFGAAGQEAATAKAAAERANQLLDLVESKAEEAGTALNSAVKYASDSGQNALSAEEAAKRAENFAGQAEEYSVSAVEQVKGYVDTTFGDMSAALDGILEIQSGFIGGEGK